MLTYTDIECCYLKSQNRPPSACCLREFIAHKIRGLPWFLILTMMTNKLELKENYFRMTTTQHWTQLNQPPIASFSKLLPLNNHEFIIAPRRDRTNDKFEVDDGIYKYNSISKEWSNIRTKILVS